MEGLKRLLAATRPEMPTHPVERWTLGEYAVVLAQAGEAPAAAAFPEVAAHLAAACAACAADLAELRAGLARVAAIRRAVSSEAAARRALEEAGADPALAADLERYFQRRWDPTTLADVNALHDEFARRLGNRRGES
jgi:hypothetical protein